MQTESPDAPEYEDEYEDESFPAHAGFKLVSGDLEIFKLIYEYRLLRREHLSALTGRPGKRLHRRLFKLAQNGYLSTIRLPQQKHIYGLGRAAQPVLVEQGIAEEGILALRLRTHELKELFLKHEMMIVDIHAMLSLAGREQDLKLIAWQEGRELFDSVFVTDPGGISKLPIRPDSFFSLEDSRRPVGANRAHFFLEADRSSATHTRFRDKIRAYWHYLDQGLHMKKFKIRNFRVITVTLTQQRARNLCDLAASILPERARKYYLFTSLKNFSLENPVSILGSVYLSPKAGEPDARYPLVPPLGSSQAEAPVV